MATFLSYKDTYKVLEASTQIINVNERTFAARCIHKCVNLLYTGIDQCVFSRHVMFAQMRWWPLKRCPTVVNSLMRYVSSMSHIVGRFSRNIYSTRNHTRPHHSDQNLSGDNEKRCDQCGPTSACESLRLKQLTPVQLPLLMISDCV